MNHLKTVGKTEDELRVANHLVLWGGADLYGEHFTPETRFDSPFTSKNAVPVDWEHGLDNDPDSPGRDDILGWVDWSTAEKTADGLWVERVLDRRNEYMQFIETLIDEGLVGTSSEATRNGTRRTSGGEIQVWPIKRDTLTVQPAEPRMMSDNALSALKSLAGRYPQLKALLEVAQDATDSAKASKPAPTIKTPFIQESNMDDEKYTLKEARYLLEKEAEQIAEREEVKTLGQKVNSFEEKFDELLHTLKKSRSAKDHGFFSPDSENDRADDENKNIVDFMAAIRQGNHQRLKNVYKAAYSSAAGTTGGYIVPTELAEPIMFEANQLSVLRAAGARRIDMQSNEIEIPVVDIETAPSAGDTAFAGGAIAYWISEGGSITESEATWNQVRLTAKKLASYSLGSMEWAADAMGSVTDFINESLARASASKENYAFFRGTGAGQPQGILESGSLISATRSAASAIALADLGQMLSDFLPQSLQTGAFFASVTALKPLVQLADDPLSWLRDLRSGLPLTLMGMPLRLTGALPALNTAGDILLADPQFYAIGDRGGLEMAFSEHFKFQNYQGAWRMVRRVDGRPLIDSSVTLEDASTAVSPFVVLAAG